MSAEPMILGALIDRATVCWPENEHPVCSGERISFAGFATSVSGKMASYEVPPCRLVTEWPRSAATIQRGSLDEKLQRKLVEAGIRQAPKIDSRTHARAA